MADPTAIGPVPSFYCAIKLHQQGQIEEAEAAYRQILAAEPDHAGALHLLGVIRQQQGRHEEALELIGRAISVNPLRPSTTTTTARPCSRSERLAEAAESFSGPWRLAPVCRCPGESRHGAGDAG